MENNWKWDLIGDVIIINWIIEVFGPKFVLFIMLLIPLIIGIGICLNPDNWRNTENELFNNYSEVKVINSSFEPYSEEHWKIYSGEDVNKEENISVENVNKEENIPTKTGKEIWEERKREIEEKEKAERGEKVKKQIEEWKEEAKSK